MDPPTGSRRTRKHPTPGADMYSTVVVHESDPESEPDHDPKTKLKSTGPKPESDNIYSTMIYKGGGGGGGGGEGEEEEEDEDEESLPPLLKRLPKDFGGAAAIDDDGGEGGGGDISGTMIVKTGRVASRSSPPYYIRSRRGYPYDEDEDDGDGDISGTVVRRTKGGSGGGGGETMRRAVESMKASAEFGFARKGSGTLSSKHGGGGGEGGEQRTKVSSSSIPDSVTREDPSTKYELLNELGS